jgi:fido (protein-threonine AMPylation protein)
VIGTFAPGNTPLDPDEMEGLIPRHVTTQGELNQVEQANILEALTWLTGRALPGLLTDSFLRALHKRMFKDVWKWAGQYRATVKNLGVLPEQIDQLFVAVGPTKQFSSPCSSEQVPVEVKKLCEDTRYWISNKTFPPEECVLRFHHRLVAIYPFANGNGRHARLAADLLMRDQGLPPFAWNGPRESYLAALKAADRGDYKPLFKFVNS